MQELRIVLIIVGIIVIAGLLAHGFWTSRKHPNDKIMDRPKKRSRQTPDKASKAQNRDDDGFDKLGLGSVRVQGDSENESETLDRIDPEFDASLSAVENESDSPQSQSTIIVEDDREVKDVLLVAEPGDEKESTTEAGQDLKPQEPVDVYVLNVVGIDGKALQGAKLLPCLLSLGFKYGDMSIFHRHLETNGEGSVIFSLANMVKPGTFDLDTMEQFQTQGISLFMPVPCVGEASKNFSVMYDAAVSISKELDGELLDGYRNRFTPQTLAHYQQRVREFERQQLLVS